MLIYIKGSRWIRIEETTLNDIPNNLSLKENSTVIWEPERQLVGVIAQDGDPRHAAALIERRLRLDGSIDQDTKLVVHYVKRSGNTYEALYSSVTLREWQQMNNWVRSQPVHCEWVPLIGLAWSNVNSDRSVVLHTSDTLHFLTNAAGRIVFLSTTLIDASEENLAYSVASLAERARAEINKEVGGNGEQICAVLWLSAVVQIEITQQNQLQRIFCDSGNFTVQSNDVAIDILDEPLHKSIEPNQIPFSENDDGIIRSSDSELNVSPNGSFSEHSSGLHHRRSFLTSLLYLSKNIPLRLLFNSPREKLLVLAERWIAVYSIVAILLICLGLYVTHAAYKEGQTSKEHLAALRSQIKEVESDLQDAAVKEPQGIQAQLDFIANFRKVTSGFDLKEILNKLKDAAGTELKILAVRSDDTGPKDQTAQQAFFVDGLLSATSQTTDGTALSAFLKSLENGGYTVIPIESKASGAPNDISVQLFTYRVVVPK